MKPLLTLGLGIISLATQAQLTVQSGATLFIDAGASVTVQGDLVSNANITGTGKIIMKGTALQNLNMNGFTIPNLDIDNTNNVALGGDTKVSGALSFVNGKLQLGNYNFILSGSGSFAGAGAGKFAETNGTGEFRDEVSAVGSVTLPVGVGADYNPVTFQLAGNTFSSAYVAARVVAGGHPAKHPRSSDFLNQYWMLSTSGVSGGTVTTSAVYVEGADVTGTESLLNTMTYNGSAWALGTSIDNTTNTVTAPMSGTSSQLYAMNKFVLVTPKVFLQGAFDGATGLMRDQLRNSTMSYTPGNLPGTNLIPTNDPYRTAPYNSFFSHTASNDVPEQLTSTAVLNDQANPSDNVVDWVFLELRTATGSGSALIQQTRSALVRRDGTIVDIDGTSPVYFKNLDAGSNYVVTVRHRNHLGISSNPATPISLGLANSSFDFTNTGNTANIFGTANTNYTQISSKNVLWSGNMRNNAVSNWSGLNNDKDYLYITLLGSNSGNSILGAYGAGDVNMNRNTTWSGLNNDKDYLYIQVLGSNSGNSKNQALPTNN